MALKLKTVEQKLAAHQSKTMEMDGFVRSAVLLPLFHIDQCEHLLFTKRTETLEKHKGQISFPGGRQDEGESLLECALRETREEVGIQPEDIQILGRLDEIWTPTGYLITPFVGAIPYPYSFTVSEAEIERLIIVPLRELLDPAIYEETEIHHRGRRATVPYYNWRDQIIWGATGRILRQFLSLVYTGRETSCENGC